MKKKDAYKSWRIDISFQKKNLLKIKLMILCLLLGGIQLMANNTLPKSDKLTLDFTDTSMEEILQNIEEKSDLYFIYNRDAVDVNRKVNISCSNMALPDILDELFKETNVKYMIQGKHIILKNKPEYTMQQNTITGKVTDSSGSPLPGVAVVIKGTTIGTITDANGNFQLSMVTAGAVLQFSFIGMKMEEIEYTNQTTINVTLEEESIGINEVIAIGYGTVKKKDVTGSVGSVDAEDITARGATGVLESMQGAIAGVNISQSSARPGGGFHIQIRGQNTLNSDANPPLYVVDGIVTDDINFINPSDIVSIDILKDASSTAIYGSRGSNGVVLVTTRNAKDVKEGKTTVTYNGSYGVKTPARLPKQYSGRDWFEYRSHAYLTYKEVKKEEGEPDPVPAYVWDMAQQGVYMYNPEAARRAYDEDYTDWLDLITQNGTQQNHYINFAANSGKMSFNVGMGYQDEEGIFIKENLKRYNLKLSLNYKISDQWQLGATSNLSQTEIESGNPDAYTQATRMSPILHAYDENGNIIIKPGLAENMGGVGNNFTGNTNPLWEIQNGSNNTRRHDVLVSAYLQFSPIVGLDIKTVIQPKFKRNRIGKYEEMVDNILQRKEYSENSEAFDYTWDNIITYQKSLNGVHNFKATGIHSVYSSRIEKLQVKAQGLPYDSQWYNIFTGSVINSDSNSGYSEVKMLSYLGRLNYDYAGKYLLTASVRYDGSSKLADKWALFPSFAAAWRLSEENFMQANFLSNLKLRFSYGKSGNNNGVGAFATFMGPQYDNMLYYNYGSTPINGFAPGVPVNPDLTWEKTTESNLGVDYGFFNGRISGSIDLYNRLSDDLLMDRLLAIESGVSKMKDNIGSVRNKGIELSLSTVNIQTRNFRWSTNFTFAKNKNEIVSLYGRKEDVVGEKRFIGESINVIYDYKFNGVFTTAEAEAAKGGKLFSNYDPNPGHAKVVDTNKDGAITSDDKTILGSPDPKWIGGFTTYIQYKNFDFNLSLIANHGRFVRDQFASNNIGRGQRSQMMWADPEDYYYPQGALRPDWDNPITDANGNIIGIGYAPAAEENADAKYPAYKGNEGSYYSSEAMNYREVSFVKIKNISLGYNLNKDMLAKVGLSKVRLYVNVLDPFVFSDYVGWDPEYTTTKPTDGNGPSSITYQFGVNVEF